MSPPESEWMLWAMRLKTWVRAELDQPSQDIESISTRCAKVEEATAVLGDLKGEVERITACNEHLQRTVSALQGRILEVESESTTRNRTAATETSDLREASRLLSEQLKDIVQDFDQVKRESKATQEVQRREQQELKQQIAGLISSVDASTKSKVGSLALIAVLPSQGIFTDITAAAHTPPLGATAVDEPPAEANDPPEGLFFPPRLQLRISQGNETFPQYLASGEAFVRDILQRSEAQAVKAYIKGLKQKFRRQAVCDALEAKGWTWANASHEIQMIIDEGKKRRQSRRTMQLPSLGNID
ncbi:MAG: hypothetical protein LQ337_001628 [Flavoplaca oasis]|nr:MAG: hypothetical protein LQ337_001628 [Flavoplaca oasis]